MTASELRLGNLVDLGNRIAKVVEIGGIGQGYCVVTDLEETQNTIEDYDRTKPIPLTEEWLLKFGFSIWFFAFIDDECRINISGIYYNLKYVHQLQNLYFALTGEELTFKSE